MKKIKFFICIAALCCASLCLPACDPGGGEVKGLDAYFSDGKLTLAWSGSGSFEVYKAEDGENYEKVAETKARSYSTDDYYSTYIVKSVKNGAVVSQSRPYRYLDILGENVRIFGENDDKEDIQAAIDVTYKRLIWDEFSERRQAFMFLPGEYDVTARTGYYTGFYGLGRTPEDVTLSGFRTEESPLASGSLVNFWRAAENFSVENDALWCVSQATSLRRMNFKGDLALDGGGYSSGGFLADSVVAGRITNSTQQQWFTRNSRFSEWTKSDINMVFSGVEGKVANTWPNPRNTVLETTTVMREKPYIVFDETDGLGVVVPEIGEHTKGVSWKSGATGKFISLSDFYIADAQRDTAKSLNAALAEGKHLLFTPGIYRIEQPIEVGMGDTVILGLGLATLQTAADNVDCCIRVGDVSGVCIGGLLVDAGSECQALMRVGDTVHANSEGTPICLSDMFFRLGGGRLRNDAGELEQRSVGADITLEVNSDNVIGDNFWMWRADHGMDGSVLEPFTDADGGLLPDAAQKSNWAYWRNFCVGWKGEEYSNYGKNGVVVNGDGVTFYGLMVEHYGEYQTLWKGENGFMCFYQSETPYDAPDQAAWKNGSKNGYASYKVADNVKTHSANGVGVYYVCNGKGIKLDNAIEAPAAAGVSIFHMAVANFKTNDGNGINSIINGRGKGVFSSGAKTSFTSFADGKYKE